MTRKPPPPGLPAGLEAWAGPTTLSPTSTAPAPSVSAIGPKPAPPQAYAEVHTPAPPLDLWNPVGESGIA
eukprot:11104441-Lingulodinium_polyedra.AAC.1